MEMVTDSPVRYGVGREAWDGYHAELLRLMSDLEVKRVCEVGGGANPAVSRDFLAERGIDYTLLDISQEELDKAPAGYAKIRANICNAQEIPDSEFDFVFTKMLAEHVPSGSDLHRNIFAMLAPGGYAFHFFPTLYAMPFVVNLLLPERLSHWILDIIAPRDRVMAAKFPAYYSWCRGPTSGQLARLRRLGYEVVEYRGLYGAEGYYSRIPFGEKISRWFTHVMLRHPSPHLTAFSMVLLRKPDKARKIKDENDHT